MAARIFPRVPSYLTIRQINFQGRSNSVPLSTRTVTPPPPYVAPPRNIMIRLGAPRNNLDMAPLEGHFQTDRESRTPPLNVPTNSIRTPPPIVERINTLLPPFASTSELDSPVNAQPSTPTASQGPRDTIETIGVEEHSTEGQDIVVEGPPLPLDPGIALLNYH